MNSHQVYNNGGSAEDGGEPTGKLNDKCGADYVKVTDDVVTTVVSNLF